jgi:hypothetical protein
MRLKPIINIGHFWPGDPEGHSEAAIVGWLTRKHSKNWESGHANMSWGKNISEQRWSWHNMKDDHVVIVNKSPNKKEYDVFLEDFEKGVKRIGSYKRDAAFRKADTLMSGIESGIYKITGS